MSFVGRWIKCRHCRQKLWQAIPRMILCFPCSFWWRVDKKGPGDCWLWRGSKTASNDYGGVQQDYKCRRTHIVAWELTFGPVPAGVLVLHKCNIKLCCNPGHLKLGDHLDNVEDMREAGTLVVFGRPQ